MDPTDADVIRRWHGGDARAFEELVRRWQQPVARLLGRVVGRTELVQDLSQEVFLRVYRARHRYRGNGSFNVWLYRIALNVARDALRRNRRGLAPLEDEPAAPGDPADETCARAEGARLVARAVAELPEPLRTALVLRHYEWLAFEEIARLTATPASTIKSRFSAALARLRVRLEEMGMGT